MTTANIEMKALVVAIIIILVIVIIVVTVVVIRAKFGESITSLVATSDESLTLPDAEIARIIAVVAATQKSRGSVFDFSRALGNSAVTPIKYAQLVTLYKNGNLQPDKVRAVLA